MHARESQYIVSTGWSFECCVFNVVVAIAYVGGWVSAPDTLLVIGLVSFGCVTLHGVIGAMARIDAKMSGGGGEG